MPNTIQMDYKNLLSYQTMDDGHRKAFDFLAEFYGQDLNKGPNRRNTIYTLHDFDHHCFNIYRIISDYLLREAGIQILRQEELYLLNLAVLFHDVSMCKGGFERDEKTGEYKRTDFDRNIHSLQSAQWLRNEYKNEKSCLYRQGGLSLGQLDILCKICEAHSNIKSDSYHESENGILNDRLGFSESGKVGTVRTKALAGILRVADELDVTGDRVGNGTEESDLDPDDEQDKISKQHWERLKLIRAIEVDGASVLKLLVNESEIQEKLDGGDEWNLRESLSGIVEKIQAELNTLWSAVLDRHEDSARLTTIRQVELSFSDAKMRDRIFSNLPPRESLPAENEDEALPDETEWREQEPGDGGPGTQVAVLDPNLEEELCRAVMEHDLLFIGHFQLNETYCARDWINTGKLFDIEELSGKMVKAISSHIRNSHGVSGYTLVGLDVTGTILATKVSFYLGAPFTYVIPAHQSDISDVHEVNIPEIADDSRIILVADCIATGATVRRVVQDNGWEDRLSGVYSIFYRKPQLEEASVLNELNCNICTLNRRFPIEISYVKKCPYGAGSCRATNKKFIGGSI